MEPKVVVVPLEVENHLFAMDLDRDGLLKAIRYAESEKALCTANDAVGFSSMVVYARSGRRLREIYIPQGWEKDDSNNQVAIRNTKKKVRIVPCNFDEFTGDRFATPSNRSPKGEVSRTKSLCNRTAWIPGLVEHGSPVEIDGYTTWVLGMYIVDGERTRAELSLPVDFDGNYFTEFGTRIILLDGSDEDAAPGRKREEDGEFGVIDIVVKRK